MAQHYGMPINVKTTRNKFSHFSYIPNIRVMCKVRKTHHQNPEFGHTEGETRKKKNLHKSTLAFKEWVKLKKP